MLALIVLAESISYIKKDEISGISLGVGLFLLSILIVIEFRMRMLSLGKRLKEVNTLPARLELRLDPFVLLIMSLCLFLFALLTWRIVVVKGGLPGIIAVVTCTAFAYIWFDFLMRLLQRQPLLEIGHDGIRHYKKGFMPWSGINTLRIDTVVFRGAKLRQLKLQGTSTIGNGNKPQRIRIKMNLSLLNIPSDFTERVIMKAYSGSRRGTPTQTVYSDTSNRTPLELAQEIESLSIPATELLASNPMQAEQFISQIKDNLRQLEDSRISPPQRSWFGKKKLEKLHVHHESLRGRHRQLMYELQRYLQTNRGNDDSIKDLKEFTHEHQKKLKMIEDELEQVRFQIQQHQARAHRLTAALQITLITLVLFGLFVLLRLMST